ncbi:MAG: YiiD C-terminal domain-containing protein [Mariprofundus sp.]
MVRLKFRPELLNHVGSLHASAIHDVAESASGHFLILNLLPHFPDSLVLARKASIQYKRPVTADCSAKAEVDQEKLSNCVATLKRRKSTVLNVPVTVFCEGRVVATAEFEWWLRVTA